MKVCGCCGAEWEDNEVDIYDDDAWLCPSCGYINDRAGDEE